MINQLKIKQPQLVFTLFNEQNSKSEAFHKRKDTDSLQRLGIPFCLKTSA